MLCLYALSKCTGLRCGERVNSAMGGAAGVYVAENGVMGMLSGIGQVGGRRKKPGGFGGGA